MMSFEFARKLGDAEFPTENTSLKYRTRVPKPNGRAKPWTKRWLPSNEKMPTSWRAR